MENRKSRDRGMAVIGQVWNMGKRKFGKE